MLHTKEQVKVKIDALKFILSSIRHKALWYQHYNMTHSIDSAMELVKELEREIDNV